MYDSVDSRVGEVQIAWIFTYNLAAFLGPVLELYNMTGEKGYLNDAITAVDYTLNNLVNSNDRLFKSKCEGGWSRGFFVCYSTHFGDTDVGHP